MAKRLFLLCIGFVMWSDGREATLPTVSLLVIDTEGKDAYAYNSFVQGAQDIGFSVTYRSLFDVLNEDKEFPSATAVLWIVGPSFLAANNIQSDVGQAIVKTIKQIRGTQTVLMGFLLPNMPSGKQGASLVQGLLKLSEFFPPEADIKLYQEFGYFLDSALSKILMMDRHEGARWGTSLLLPESQSAVESQYCMQEYRNTKNMLRAVLLPASVRCHEHPAGMLIQRATDNRIFFFSKASVFIGSDIEENFLRTSFDPTQRLHDKHIAQQMLQDLYRACVLQALPPRAGDALPLSDGLSVSRTERARQAMLKRRCSGRSAWLLEKGCSGAWLSEDDFFADDDALKKGIRFLFDAGFSFVWFEFNPEWYFSARGLRRHKEEEFTQRVRAIARELATQSHVLNKPIPKIFLGTDITSNYAEMPVPHPVVDVFGKIYSKIPTPLDYENVWYSEGVEPLVKLYNIMRDIVPIEGIFLDLEMYHAQHQAATYTDLMDFSHYTWRLFCATQNLPEDVRHMFDARRRIKWVQEHAYFDRYRNFLTERAVLVGQRLKNDLRTKMPGILIGVYSPFIPASWFYRGLLAGLSAATDPILLATFNTEFQSHIRWLEHHDIYALHGGVIMMSKLQSAQDKASIVRLHKEHDFVWYNRPSRVTLPYDRQQWWSLEASPLSASELARIIQEGSH